MKRRFRTVLAALTLGLLMALSTTIALAGFDYEDCPPAAQAGWANSSDQAKANWAKVFPPAPANAWYPTNPGNK